MVCWQVVDEDLARLQWECFFFLFPPRVLMAEGWRVCIKQWYETRHMDSINIFHMQKCSGVIKDSLANVRKKKKKTCCSCRSRAAHKFKRILFLASRDFGKTFKRTTTDWEASSSFKLKCLSQLDFKYKTKNQILKYDNRLIAWLLFIGKSSFKCCCRNHALTCINLVNKIISLSLCRSF